MIKMIQNSLSALVIGLTACLLAAPAFGDKIVKHDGSVLEGEITRESDTFLFLVVRIGAVEKSIIVPRTEIASIERDGGTSEPETLLSRNTPAKEKRDARVSDGATKVSFISLEGEVGLVLNANSLRRAAAELEDDGTQVLVLVINSGGGFAREVEPLSDVIHEELKSKYRVVAWVESAISAACMTTWNCEEIYMTSQGALGGNVAFIVNENGETEAAEGPELEFFLRIGRELSRRGNHDPLVMQAMQKFSPLSCDVDVHGNVRWFENEQGEYLVNPMDRILTFNSVDAERFKVSRGTADTKEELMQAMGIAEWVEVGEDADDHIVKFRKNVDNLNRNLNRLWAEYQQGLELAQAGNDRLRERGLGQARSRLRQIRAGVRKAPSFEEYTIFTPDWFAEREQELRDLARDGR